MAPSYAIVKFSSYLTFPSHPITFITFHLILLVQKYFRFSDVPRVYPNPTCLDLIKHAM